MLFYRIAILAVAFVMSVPVLLFGQQGFVLSGTISSTEGHSLPNATVFVHELNMGTTTNMNGYYEFKNIKPGSYHVHVYFTGYETGVKAFKVTDGPLALNLTLKVSNLELKAFVLEESMLNSDNEERSVSVDVADRKFIERNAGTSFARTLEKIPGINSLNMGTGISKPVIRGMSFNRIAVAENGIKQEGQQWGADHGLEIDQHHVERVEIIKGPASLIYGSDAMGGVVNIRPAIFPDEGTFSSSAGFFAASNNDLLGTSVMAAGNNKGRIFRLRYTHQEYGDYKVPAENFTYNGYILPIENGRLKNTAGRENSFNSTFGLNRNWGYSTISLSLFDQNAGLFSGALGTPRSYQLKHDGDFRNIDLPAQKTRHIKVLSNTHVLFKQNWLALDLGYQNNYRQELSLPHAHGALPPNPGNVEHGLLLQTYTANLRYHVNHSDKSTRIYGFSASVQGHQREGFQFLLPDYQAGNLAAFVFQKLKLGEQLHVNGGLRYDQAFVHLFPYFQPIALSPESTVYQQKSNELSKAFGNFSGAVGMSWVRSEATNFKANLGSSFRTPAPYELSANGVHHGAFRHEMGDGSLKSERGYQLDLGLHYHKKDFLFAFTPFFNYFDGYIFLSPSGMFSTLPEAGQLYRFMQTDAILSGAEIKTDYHFSKALHFGVTAEYVWSIDIENGYPLPFVPPFSSELDLEYEFEETGKYLKNSFLNFSLKGIAAQNFTARNEPSTPGYVLMNISTGTEITLKDQNLKIIFGIYNLANTRYMGHLSRYRILNLPEPGRNFRISILLPIANYKRKTNVH